MRGAYIAPSITHYDAIFRINRGGGLDDISIYQRGGSFIGILGKLARYTIPFLKSIILPEIPSFVSNISNDVSSGVKLKDSIKRRGINTISNMGVNVLRKARGGRRVRKSKSQTKRRKIKRKRKKTQVKKKDIFSKRNYIN